jgi:phage-related protein
MWTIEFYETETGSKPAEEFILSLDKPLISASFAAINHLQTLGNVLRMPHSRAMGNGLFELRVRSSKKIVRVFYFFFVNRKAVLTNGFVKKTQQTPSSELELARKYKADYERRHSLGNNQQNKL